MKYFEIKENSYVVISKVESFRVYSDFGFHFAVKLTCGLEIASASVSRADALKMQSSFIKMLENNG